MRHDPGQRPQRQLHLRHHAHPLAGDDLEGEGALVSLWRAALTAPLASVHMRVVSFGAVNQHVLPWVIVENVINLLVAVAVVVSAHPGLQAAFAMVALLQLTMNAWASHVPHRAPHWLIAWATKLAWTRSPVVLSLVYHLEHHAHPRLPCAQLRSELELSSPLTQHNEARAEKLPWAQLSRGQGRLIGVS